MPSYWEDPIAPFWNREEGRLRAPWRLLATVVVLLLVGQIVATVGSQVLGFVEPDDPALLAVWVTAVTAATAAALFAVTVALVRLVDRRPLSGFGLEPTVAWWRDLLAGLGVGILMAAVVGATLLASGLATVDGVFVSGSADMLSTTGSTFAGVLLWFVFYAAVGVFEELLVRGYVLVNVADGLRAAVPPRRSARAAVGATAGLFGLLHAANPGATVTSIANIALVGIVLGWAFVATGRLALPIGVHVTWNFTLGVGLGLPVSGLGAGTALLDLELQGPPVLTGGPFGPEGGLVTLLGTAVGAVALAWWIRRTGGDLRVDERIAKPDLLTDDDGTT